MIVLEQGLNGYDDGLNGLRIGSFLKRNLKSAVKDVGNVAKVVAPLALSFIPVAGGAIGGIAGKILNKVTTNSDGSASLVGRIADNVKQVSQTNTGKSLIKLASPLAKNAKAALLEQAGIIPSNEQLATLAELKGTTPQQELDAIVAAAPAQIAAAAPTKTNYTLPIVGGVAALGIAYMVFK